MRFWYPASISQITEINDSFDSALLRICYAGKNRNRSELPKNVIEDAIPTMAYCPVVANYTVESDEIGGHDVEIVRTDSGELKMVNLTDAVGVVPANPEWSWMSVTEDDGAERDYLCTPVILWKRAAVYEKLKREGISGQSMEIRIKEGRVKDGSFVVDSFEFTAFCLLGRDVEPCFESAALEMYSANKLSERFDTMMSEYKRKFTDAMADDTAEANSLKCEEVITKGGESSLNINELMAKYGLTADDVSIDINGKSVEEIEQLFSNIHDTKFAGDENEPDSSEDDQNSDSAGEGSNNEGTSDDEQDEGADDDDDDNSSRQKQTFQLTGEQMIRGICDALSTETYTDEWGTWTRYGYMDYSLDDNEVYVYDFTDWNLYGFTYSMNGDYVVIDFDSKKRKRLAYVNFDEGDASANYKYMLDGVNKKFATITSEITELRKFKSEIEDAERKAKIDDVFSRFDDLSEDAKFIELQNNCSDMSVEEIEDKCFAIRGRKVNVQMKFSQDPSKPVRLPVERKTISADEPYGGLFVEYGVGNN